jgi:hypothetical protein
MPATDLFRIFTDRLEEAGIPYMVTGSVASMVYGEPRLTHDVDVVVKLTREDAGRVRDTFGEEGFYCPPEEAIKVEAARRLRGRFNLIHYETGYKADLYLVGQDPLHRWAMANRVHVDVGGGPIWLAPPEYVILRKLEYYREGRSEKHLRDIAAMLDVSGDRIDLAMVEQKSKELGLTSEWDAAKGLREHLPGST